MHLGIPALLEFYREHRDEESLVLATIIATNGSTYRKPGAMMLINREGAFEGLISGGCLESDLLHHATAVFETGMASHVTYDMHADEELVWNLGLGCDGVVHLLLQRLDRSDGFGFLEELEAAHHGRCPAILALVTNSTGSLNNGEYGLLVSPDKAGGNPDLTAFLDEFKGNWPGWRCKTVVSEFAGEPLELALIHIPAQTSVLICGAGPDAVPVEQLFSALNWKVQLVDHRPAYAQTDRFTGKCMVKQLRPGQLAERVDLEDIDAVVIMSHHLENDAEYLRQVAGAPPAYVGLLGPAARRERLLEMAGCRNLPAFGPVGLDIGAELPESIALSIAAEIHAVLNQRDGQSLTGRKKR